MTNQKIYRLGHFKIIETGNQLRWQSHSGFGSEKTGKCLKEGEFLIIGPAEAEKASFLKREFMEHLDKLPLWDRTKYYCSSHAVKECKTGERMDLDFKIRGESGEPERALTGDAVLRVHSNTQKKEAESELKRLLNSIRGMVDMIRRVLSQRP